MFRPIARFTLATTAFIAGSLITFPALADTVNLGGTVTSTSSVTSTATAGAGALSLAGEGTAASDVVTQVADIAMISNNSEGVTLTASGDTGLTNGTDTVAYQVLIVADGATAPVAADFSSSSDSKSVADFDGNGDSARDLYIEYDAPALLDPGNYTATITVTVTDL